MCALASLTLAGCSFAPDYSRPVMDLPATWNGPVTEQGLEVQWWKRFEDPILNKLVNEALAYNQNLAAAMARVEQARAYLGYARGEQFPTLAGSGSGGKAASAPTLRPLTAWPRAWAPCRTLCTP